MTARLVGQWLSQRLGQPFVIENRPGAGTNIATESVVKAPTDGYTLLLGSTTISINPGLRNDLPYDTLKDFQPLSMLSRIPYVLVAHPKAGFKTVQEMIANPPEWLADWGRMVGAKLEDGLRENPSFTAFARDNGTVYHTYTVAAPDPFVAPYHSFLLRRTPKPPPDEFRAWRKDEYLD